MCSAPLMTLLYAALVGMFTCPSSSSPRHQKTHYPMQCKATAGAPCAWCPYSCSSQEALTYTKLFNKVKLNDPNTKSFTLTIMLSHLTKNIIWVVPKIKSKLNHFLFNTTVPKYNIQVLYTGLPVSEHWTDFLATDIENGKYSPENIHFGYIINYSSNIS